MVMPRGLEPRISSLRGWRVIPVPLWHHINRQLFHSGSAPAFLSLTRTDTLNVFSRTILFLIRTFPLQIKRDIAGLSTTPPCTGKIRQVTPTTLSLIVWPLQSQSLRVGYGKLCSPSGREPTACWRAPAFRRGLESVLFKKMNGGGPFRGGAGDRTRTCNLMITRHLLYQLELHQHIEGRHCSNHLNYRPQLGPGGIRTQHLWPPVHRVRFLRKPTLKENRRFLSPLIVGSRTQLYPR